MLKNRTEQHCWTTLIKTKARFLILSFGMWLTEFSSSAWNKALNNSKQIFFFFLSTVLNSANISAASEYRTSSFWYDNSTLTRCDEIWLLYSVKHSYWQFHPVSSVSLLKNTLANQCKLQVSVFQRIKNRSSLSNLPDLELRNLVLWRLR